MGWSTQIVVARKWDKDEKLSWETLNGRSIEILEWNRLYLLCYYFKDLPYFKEERYEIERTSLPVDDNSRYTGWYCSALSYDTLLKLMEKEEIEKFVDYYSDIREFKTKKQRNEFKKAYTSALKTCLHFLNNVPYTGIYLVEG